MKKLFILLILIFTVNLWAKPFDQTHKVLVLKDWKPYYYVDKNNKPSGYAIELFEKIASNINLKYEYVVAESWNEAWKFIETGKIDIIPNMGITKSRADLLSFTQQTDIFEIGLFKNTNLTDINSLNDIHKNHSIGVVLKNVCCDLINDDITKHKILYNNYHKALAALNEGKIDILCYPKELTESSVKELNLKNISYFGIPLKSVPRAIATVKDEDHLVDIFDKELLRIKGNGEYQKIYERWFVVHKDIEIQIDYEFLIFILLIFLLIIFMILYYIINNKLLLTKNELNKKVKELEVLQTEQLEQQKILMTRSKIEAVGEMIGNIAHQWRQPLSVISTHVSSLQADIDLGNELNDEKIYACAENVLKQTNYLSKTIDDFRDFFKADSQILKEHSLTDLFGKLKDLVEASFKSNHIECLIDIKEDIKVNINDNILIQSLINICNNSKDAIIQNVKDTDQRYFYVQIEKEGNNAVIIFKDSGGGIKEEIMDKIFDPYFTTKHPSVGTGIGLYMTYQIITKHLKGTIDVSNTEFEYKGKKLKGAQFKITIPLS